MYKINDTIVQLYSSDHTHIGEIITDKTETL